MYAQRLSSNDSYLRAQLHSYVTAGYPMHPPKAEGRKNETQEKNRGRDDYDETTPCIGEQAPLFTSKR